MKPRNVYSILRGSLTLFTRFLLAERLIDRLCHDDYHDEDSVRLRIRQLAKETLEELYSESLKRIAALNFKAREAAMNTFALLLYQREPLAPNTIITAIAQTEGPQSNELQLAELLKHCNNLISYDSDTNTLRFVHTSVQEFFEAQPALDVAQGNQSIALSCINMCIFGPMTDSMAELSIRTDFYQYSVLYWAEHLRCAGLSDSTSQIFIQSMEFVFGQDGYSLSFMTWMRVAKKFSEKLLRHHSIKRDLSAASSSLPNLLFVSCVFGLSYFISVLDRLNEVDWNQKNDTGHTGLYLASLHGHRDLVEFLFEHGANANLDGGTHGNALQAACFKGKVKVAELLIQYGADPNIHGRHGNAIQASMNGGHEDLAV